MTNELSLLPDPVYFLNIVAYHQGERDEKVALYSQNRS